MTYQVKLQDFEGPLDLLLHLIRKNEFDIYNVPVAQIANQYLEYVDVMESLNLDGVGDFLVMAATLAYHK
jgi:segregation and condensation protein A